MFVVTSSLVFSEQLICCYISICSNVLYFPVGSWSGHDFVQRCSWFHWDDRSSEADAGHVPAQHRVLQDWQPYRETQGLQGNIPHVLSTTCMTDCRLVPSQWETSLESNAVSQWLGANLESALRETFAFRNLLGVVFGKGLKAPRHLLIHREIHGEIAQYHGYWCADSLCPQDIRSHYHKWILLTKSQLCRIFMISFSYTLSREYRVVRNRYSRLLFTNEDRICANLRVQEQSTNMTSQCQGLAFAWRYRSTVMTSQC